MIARPFVLALAISACGAGPPRAPTRNAAATSRFVIVHGVLFTATSDAPDADAVEVADGRIRALGRSRTLAEHCIGDCTVIDAGGGFIMPGFHDAHAHPFSAGEAAAELAVHGASIPAIQAAVSSYSTAHPRDRWILGRGWASARFRSWPTARDLDAAEASRPVVLTDTSGHNVWANSAALAAAGVTESTPDPPGGKIAHPLGVLLDAAQLLVTRHQPPLDDGAIARFVEHADAQRLAMGITSTAEGGTESLRVAEVYARLDREGRLATRVFLWAPLGGSDAEFRRWTALAESLPREGKVHVAAFKGFADGTMVAHTAAMLEPYVDMPETRGNLYYGQALLDRQVLRANRAGYPVAIHAIGDRAVRQALDAFEHSKGALRHGLVNRVEHTTVVDPADLPRFAALGVAASVQPAWLSSYPSAASFVYAERIPASRQSTIYPWRSLADAGASLLFGSDYPSSPVLDPIFGIHAAVTRRFTDGGAFLPEQTLSPDAALRAYTANTSEAMGWGNRLGKLAPGYDADILILDHDPRVGAKSMAEDPVRRVWVGGVERKGPPR
jgi:predicted amidohydrolase YtcJ